MPPVDLATLRALLAARSPRLLDAEPGAPQAAVAAILRPAERSPEVLLVRRAEHPNDPWSGHMAFPGGRRDPDDPDLLATAVRETREEVGLDLSAYATPLGRLDDVAAIARGRRTGLTIAPFVFELKSSQPLSLNEEVAEAIWAPIAPLITGEVATTLDYALDGRSFRLPGYDVNGRIVWGLTYQMLQLLFEVAQSGRGTTP